MRTFPPPLARHTPAAGVSALLLASGYWLYGSTGHDDSHITFWAASSLLEHGQILNYNGDRVEQSSSLLLTLLLALISRITDASVVNAGYCSAILASGLTLLLAANANHTVAPRRLATPLLLGSCASFLLWSFSGMETTLAALCLLWMLCSWARYLAQPSRHWITLLPATTALLLVRPEMPLLALALASWRVIALKQENRRRAASILLLVMLLTAALCWWRETYFGSVFPQPVAAKSARDHALSPGLYYLLFNTALNPVLLIGLLTAAMYTLRPWFMRTTPALPDAAPHSAKTYQHLLSLASDALLAYLAFIMLVGGDWMQAGRFMVPILPLACLLAIHASTQLRRSWIRYSVLGALIIAQGALQQPAIATQSHGTPVWTQYRLDDRFLSYSRFEHYNQEHVRDMAVIDHLNDLITALHSTQRAPVTLLSGQSGMVFYYTALAHPQQVRFMDLRGLTDRQLTDCPVTAAVPRGAQGLFWGYADFFAHLPQLQQQCGITAPDIIYDLNDMSQKLGVLLTQYGYVLVHQEQGFVLENNTSLPWNRLLAPNMIFVRQAALARLPTTDKRLIRYVELPLRSRWPIGD